MKTSPVGRRQAEGFTLVELLTVMTIIGILAGLVLGTFKFVQEKAARSRAEAEIKAMEAAMESYKADNGAYPIVAGTTDTLDSGAATLAYTASTYGASSLEIYKALTGDLNADRRIDKSSSSLEKDTKQYFEFKPNQLNPSGGTAQVTAIADPWGNSYGYSTINQTDSTKGNNPTFDLWSTGGQTAATADAKAKWLKNW